MDLYWIAAAVPMLVQFGLFLRWLHRHMRNDEIQRVFIRDIALNHLPHLYHVLRQVAEHIGIEVEDPPLIRYVVIDEKEKS